MSFEKAFEVIIGNEGVYDNDPRDRGNWDSGIIGRGNLLGTKYGIAAHAYPSLDIEALTLDDARRIYRTDYWDKIQGDSLPAAVALAAFDCAVNQGTNRATRLLQRALGVKDDGVVGPQTLSAAQSMSTGLFLERFLAERALHYARLPTFETFGRGWMRRLFRVCLEAAKV